MMKHFLAVLFWAGAAWAAGQYVKPQAGEEVTGDLIVRLKPGQELSEAHRRLRPHYRDRWAPMSLSHIRKVRVDEAEYDSVARVIAADPAVDLVEPDRILHIASLPAPDDGTYPAQGNLALVRALQAWRSLPGRFLTSPVTFDRERVAVLDTGADCTHPDFINLGGTGTNTANGGQLDWSRSSAIRATTVPSAACPWQDDNGHGSHVAGIVAAATNNNGRGVASLGYMVQLVIIKLADKDGNTTTSEVANAIVSATDAGARVVNMSLIGGSFSQVMQDAIDYAWARNVVVVAAAGNTGATNPNATLFPASSNHVVGVGAVNNDGQVPGFSTRGNTIDIMAPGAGIHSLAPTYANTRGPTDYVAISGTSMSAPHVAALAGLLMMASPGIAGDAVVARIQRSAEYSGDGWSTETAYGYINAEKAITGEGFRTATLGGVVGQVQDTAGLAISGATVTLNSVAVVTVAGGLFRFSGISPGDYTMTVAASGQTTLSIPVTVAAGFDTPTHIRMGRSYGTFTGTLTANGSPVAGAIVQGLQNGVVQGVAVTNSSGVYRLFVPAGTYEIRSGAFYQSAASADARTVASGATTSVNLTAQGFGRLEGTVRNSANAAVGDAQIALTSSNRSLGAVSDGSGNYRTIPTPAATYTASASTPTAASTPANVEIVNATTSRLDMVVFGASDPVILNPASATFGPLGGPGSVNLTTQPANLAWTATTAEGWIQLGASSGTGSGTLNFTLLPNAETGARSGSIQINGIVFRITQNPATGAFTANPASLSNVAAAGSSGTIAVTGSGDWVASSQSAFITITAPGAGNGNGTFAYTIAANSGAARTGSMRVNGQTISVSQNGAALSLNPTSASVPAAGGTGSIGVTSNSASLAWTATANASWISITSGSSGTGNGTVNYSAAANNETAARSGTISIGSSTFTLNQPAASLTLDPSSETFPASGGSRTVTVTAPSGFAWTATPSASWITITSGGTGTGGGTIAYSIAANSGAALRTGSIQVGPATLAISQAGTSASGGGGLHFVPITPCRIADTREPGLGAFGQPRLEGGSPRDFVVPNSACGIPSNARAYSLNVTVVPSGPLGFLTIWPAGSPQPVVSTLNAIDGRVKANAALVAAGTGGAISILASDPTNLVIDINGYFVDPGSNSANELAFYPLPACRLLDTRSAGGTILSAGVPRELALRTAGNCNIPANARAYSLNATVVPSGPLGYLTLWPTGQNQPFVSTLNAPKGSVVANAAIVPAGTNGSVSVFAQGNTHLIVDINGYFAPPGGANAQRFYPVAPCRIMDTRSANGALGGPVIGGSQTRSIPVISSNCGLPSTAKGYSLNATVVPTSVLGFLTMWPAGDAQPFVSTLNALDDKIVANALLVGAGTGGAVAAFAADATHLILDTNGYFAP